MFLPCRTVDMFLNDCGQANSEMQHDEEEPLVRHGEYSSVYLWHRRAGTDVVLSLHLSHTEARTICVMFFNVLITRRLALIMPAIIILPTRRGDSIVNDPV